MLSFERMVITGGRFFVDRARIQADLRITKPQVMAQGCSHGADRLARAAAKELGIPVEDFLPDPGVDGPWPGRGPQRNARMVRTFKPSILFGYPDIKSTGTWHCISEALLQGCYAVVWIPWITPSLRGPYAVVAPLLAPYGVPDPLVVDRGGFRVVVCPPGTDFSTGATLGLPVIHQLIDEGDP